VRADRAGTSHPTASSFTRCSIPGRDLRSRVARLRLEQLRATWDADALDLISDFIDVTDRVAVRIWRGAGHGPEANLEMTGVYTVRKGRMFAIEHFWDHAEALETWGCRSKTLMPTTPEPASG
jgi:hypothetical protein